MTSHFHDHDGREIDDDHQTGSFFCLVVGPFQEQLRRTPPCESSATVALGDAAL